MTARTSIHFSKESELIRRAADYRKLVLPEQPLKNTGCPAFDSQPVGRFEINKAFVARAQKHGFTFEPGTKPPHDKMVYLAGHSNQKGAEIFETDCWCWKREEANPYVEVSFRLWVSERHRGVVCQPHVWGNCSGGACHQPTINKLIRFIGKDSPDAHQLIAEMAHSDGLPVIYWKAIGEGGVKSVGALFDELYAGNRTVIELANSTLSPFDPNPRPRFAMSEARDNLFVPEEEHTELFKIWREQLEAFKAKLS